MTADRASGSQYQKDASRLGVLLAQSESAFIDLPDPMPARTASGERVWLHYRPLRWERHP